MVRVLQWHNFTAQDVLISDQEPVAVHSSEPWLFLATNRCSLYVYDLTQRKQDGGGLPCPRSSFSTVGTVLQMQYSQTDNFLATLEEEMITSTSQSSSKHRSSLHVRVYLNWQTLAPPNNDNAPRSAQPPQQRPMRVQVAGQNTSLRQDSNSSNNNDPITAVEVVEIPLKHNQPTCIAVDGSTGNLAIGVSKSVLIYGLCCKTVAGTNQQYEDVKCLLELEFSFPILNLAMSEEYIMCSSQSKVQVVKLNIKDVSKLVEKVASKHELNCIQSQDSRTEENLADSYVFVETTSENVLTDLVRNRESPSDTASAESGQISKQNFKSPPFKLLSRQKSNMRSDSPAGKSSSNQDSGSIRTSQSEVSTQSEDCIIEDEHHVEFYTGEMAGYMTDKALQKRTSEQGTRISSIWLKSISRAMRDQERRQRGPELQEQGTEHRGPFERHEQCPVSVEYEGVCCCEGGKEDLVERGVLTCLYKEFPKDSARLSNLQLLPVYHPMPAQSQTSMSSSPAASEIPATGEDWETYVSKRRHLLCGMSCLFSTNRQGYQYTVYDHVRRLATFPYTSSPVQVGMDDHLLYAATDAGLEVYTARTMAYVMHETQDYDHVNKTLPPYNLDTCLVGLKPFISPFSLGITSSHVILVTKFVENASRDEIGGWNIYVLTRPTLLELYSDMMELHLSLPPSAPADMHLLQEMHLLASGGTFYDKEQHGGQAAEVAMLLAQTYASQQPELTIPYVHMANLPCREVIEKLTTVTETGKEIGAGLWLYFEHLLYNSEKATTLSKDDGNAILQLYAQERPDQLSSILLNSRLSAYSTEVALSLLQSWLQSPERNSSSTKAADVLSAAILYLREGDMGDAEAVLFSLPESDVIKLCTENYDVLHNNFTTYSPLAQMLRRRRPSVFLAILVGLHDSGSIVMGTAINIFKAEKTVGQQVPAHLIEYLDLLLSDTSRHYIFNDAVNLLVPMYLSKLEQEDTNLSHDTTTLQDLQDKLRKGQGHFGPRYSWLDALPPFNGKVQKSCQRLAHPQRRKYIGGRGVSSRSSPNQSSPRRSSPNRSSSSHLYTSSTGVSSSRSSPSRLYTNSPGSGRPSPASSDGEERKELSTDGGCMLCHAPLLKLQSLLCSRYCTKDMCAQTYSIIDLSSHQFLEKSHVQKAATESHNQPSSNDSQDQPGNNEVFHIQPVAAESQDQPDNDQSHNQPDDDVLHDQSLNKQSQNQAAAAESQKQNAAAAESHDQTATAESQNHPNKGDSQDQPGGNKDKPNMDEIRATSVSASLVLLCESVLVPEKAIAKVIEMHPHILADFMKDTFGDEHQHWKFVIELLQQKVEVLKKNPESAEFSVYKKSLSDVLSLLAEKLPLSVFLTLLPGNSSDGFYRDFLEKSINQDKAMNLKKMIMAQSADV